MMADGRQKNGGARRGAGRKAIIPEAIRLQGLEAGRAFALKFLEDPQVLETLLAQARAGELWSGLLLALLPYAYGKPTEQVEHGGVGGGPITIELGRTRDTRATH